jgi:hypothetical protein
VSQSFGYTTKSGIAGSNGRSIFCFLSSLGDSSYKYAVSSLGTSSMAVWLAKTTEMGAKRYVPLSRKKPSPPSVNGVGYPKGRLVLQT